MSNQSFDEKNEKQEKSENEMHEKQEEKSEKERDKQEEKTFEEKWQRDPLGTLAWAVILIWAGLVFLAENMGLLNNFRTWVTLPEGMNAFYPKAWSLIFLGAGVIILIEVAIRLAMPAYRKPVLGNVIIAIVFLGIGLGSLGAKIIWPLILIVLGLSIVMRSILRKR